MIPKPLRDRLGLRPGPVEVTVEGTALRIEPLAGDAVVERAGVLVVPAAGEPVTDADVRALRDADQP